MRLVFPIALAVLDLGAASVCASKGQWALAVMWVCYAVASVALGLGSPK